MTDAANERGDRLLDRDAPPLDAVGSRWWYWIAAYPIVLLLSIPVVAFAALLFLLPIVVIGTAPQPGQAPGIVAVLVGFLLVFLVLTVVVLASVLIVVFPIALYMDARAVIRADLEWQPDPLLYGLLGLLQLLVTPLVGIVVAGYYLYRRHEHVGVP